MISCFFVSENQNISCSDTKGGLFDFRDKKVGFAHVQLSSARTKGKLMNILRIQKPSIIYQEIGKYLRTKLVFIWIKGKWE